MTVESLGEATVLAIVVETSGEAVARHHVGKVRIAQPVDVTDAVSGFPPELFGTMVAMLQNESPFVDGFVDFGAVAGPIGQVRHVARDVTASVWTEIIDYGIGVVVC